MRRIRLTVSLDIQNATDLEAKAAAIQLMKSSEPVQQRLGITHWQLEDIRTRKKRR